MEAVLNARRDSYGYRTEPAGKRRSLRLCLAAGILGTAAVAALLAWCALNLFSGVDHLARAPIPGAVSINAQQTGEMVVYYEGDADPSFDELALRIAGPDGATVAVKPYGHGFDLRYDIHSHVGKAVASFEASAGGHYLVSARAAEPGARLAVGRDLGGGMLLTDLAGIGVGFAVVALAAIAVALVLRRPGTPRTEHRNVAAPPGFAAA
jgi:hypothetical protein